MEARQTFREKAKGHRIGYCVGVGKVLKFLVFRRGEYWSVSNGTGKKNRGREMVFISRKKEGERTITIPSQKEDPEKPSVERLAVTTQEAAQMLSISERTLWAWTRKGIIPAVKVERRYLYSVEALRRFVNGDTPNDSDRSPENSRND